MTDWKDTTLWKQLETTSGPEADAARALLIQEMPRIQTILTQAHTAPTDFTLHDADHSFRVAKWMAEIIPGDVLKQLSPYEIALLLLSAYLHDIGMTPEQGRVDRFWYHLVYGAPDPKSRRQPITDDEARDLQDWLDDEGRELTIPLAPDGAASEETKRLADLLIAHYCRHKHNDWSADWIRSHLNPKDLPGYETWVYDLIQLCRSHHEGYDDLRQSRFEPRPAGPSGRPIHHRYLACTLRVADILEIDPERTPEVIFRHREIHPESVLYWRKDHENWIIRDGNRLVLTAYPESAVLENAIRKMADGIRQELATCARLNREQPFFYWQLRSTQPLQHRWDFPEVLTVHVQPRNDSYVYIDGAFRPNTERLLELLSGTQLYGEPLVAVRELLQNAFDAVKEEMAYQQLERRGEQDLAGKLANLHRVELRLEERHGRRWLVCKDTGVGMTRRIIEEYLLVSGSSRRREIAELERQCREAGFRLGRTGQFGIGILSYFMLADRVEIRTRRSTARADAEVTGWSFITEGVGTFGELKKVPAGILGTEVQLRLREIPGWTLSLEHRLEDYLHKTVCYIPCTLELHGLGDRIKPVVWKTGWVQSREELTQRMLLGRTSFMRETEPQRFHIPGWWERAQEALRWRVEEGELPNKLGLYRISVPWFELQGGACEAFMLIHSEEHQCSIGLLRDHIAGLLPRAVNSLESFHGMRLNSGRAEDAGVSGCREINWENPKAGRISLDRESMEYARMGSEAKRWVDARASELLFEALTERRSEYNSLSGILLKEGNAKPYWVSSASTELAWESVTFPVAPAEDFGTSEKPVLWNQKHLAVLSSIHLERGQSDVPRYFPLFLNNDPDKIVVRSLRASRFRIVRIWEGMPKSDKRCVIGTVAQFPPEWKNVCGVRLGNLVDTVWNLDHSMVSRVDEDSEKWIREIWEVLERLSFDLVVRKDILATPNRAALVLARILEKGRIGQFWFRVLMRDPSLARSWLAAVLYPRDTEGDEIAVSFLEHSLGHQLRLIVVTTDSVNTASPGDPLFEKFLPPPGPDWVITEADSDDEPT